MRNLIVTGLLAASILPAAANAISPADVRQDRADMVEEREELEAALRDGSLREIRAEYRDLEDAREEYRTTHSAYIRETGDRRYNAGRYHAPRGHAVRTVQRGQWLNRAFYASSYLIAQPARYGLAAPRISHARWVRHGNDALLVATQTGRVLQVHRHLFW